MISTLPKSKKSECNPIRSLKRFPEESDIIFSKRDNKNDLFQRSSDPISISISHRSVSSISSTNTLSDDISFENIIGNSPNPNAKEFQIKANKTNVSFKKYKTKSTSISTKGSHHNEELFISTIINKGKYLIKHQWNNFIGSEELKKYSKKVIERNDNIWEMVSLHYGCLNRLVILRDVYEKSYPYLEVGLYQVTRSSSTPRTESSNLQRQRSISEKCNVFESIESIVPGLNPMIKCFAKITNNLVENHLMRPDRVITEIGRVLNSSLTEELCLELAKLFGHFNFQRHFASQKINHFKTYPIFLLYIQKCERDPRSEKKTLSDYIQDISMFWARMTVPLNLIIEKTMNDSQEILYLNNYKEKIQKLIVEAENIQVKFANAKILKNIVENYEITADYKESEKVYNFMKADNAVLVYKGEVQLEVRKVNTGKVYCRELTGIALENCLFFLQSISEPGKINHKYQLFQDRESFPALLEWGTLYGYFREEVSKNTNAFSFYVIIEKPEPSIRRLFVNTTTERNCWKNCMLQGFSRWQNKNSNLKAAEEKLNEELKLINTKWVNTLHGLDLIKDLDNALKVQLEYRTVGFRCILEEELKRRSLISGNNISSVPIAQNEIKLHRDSIKDQNVQTYIPDLSGPDGINDWLDVFMEWVNRLKFSLYSNGCNITRSASEIEGRKRPSIQAVKKYETFSTHDAPVHVKPPPEMAFLNPPVVKQKKDQKQISVAGFANLFRMNSKTMKNYNADKENDSSSAQDSVTDKEFSDLSVFDANVKNNSSVSSLSKDSSAALIEINNAAKHIAAELIELKTQKLVYEADIKKLKDENQEFKESYKKFQKCSVDSQAAFSFENSSFPKIDSTHSFVMNSNSIDVINAELKNDSMENYSENQINFATANQSNQMAECRRQTENLRQMSKQFANDKKRWEKQYNTQRLKIEKEKDFISEKKMKLKKEQDDLLERENKYKEKCIELQSKLDLHMQKHGFNLDEKKDDIQSNSLSRSHNDDLFHKKISKSIMPAPLVTSEISNLTDLKLNKYEISEIPDQLRGSLINQERQSLKTNSSDNILDSWVKQSNTVLVSNKTKMTPSSDRRDLNFTNKNDFNIEGSEEKEWSSDMDDSTFQNKRAISNSSKKTKKEQKPNSRNSEMITSQSSANKTVGNTNQQSGPIIPRQLATKSKVKKDKSRNIFTLNR